MTRCMQAAILLTMALALPGLALAQPAAYPARPVHIVVGFPPGGGADVVARHVAARMGDFLGQPVVVENRAGASGNIAAAAVAKSAPDGYLVYLATASNAINAGAVASGSLKLDYDVQKDLRPVVLLVRNQNVLVANPALPAATLRELIALARDRPGKLNFGVMAPSSQLAGELFRQMGGVSSPTFSTRAPRRWSPIWSAARSNWRFSTWCRCCRTSARASSGHWR